MKKIKITELVIFVVATELIGVLSGIITGSSFALYSELIKPPFSPPSGVFPVVWAILYAVMGISAYLIYNSDAEDYKKRKALIVYVIQLLLNFSWSIVFFRLGSIDGALAIAVILFILLIYMFYLFYGIRSIAAYMNIPYIIWTAFAVYLTLGTLILN